ncbi:hypothetical protein H0H93_016099, partial [Arthromyces matolae]
LGLYSNNIREKALQILLAQISLHETRHLIENLIAWPDIEIQMFLNELMTLLNPIRLANPEVRSEPCIKSYCKLLSPWESNSLHAFVEFLTEIAQALKPTQISIFIHSGVLDFLLHVYVTNFFDPLADFDSGAIHRTSYLYAACQHLLTMLCEHQLAVAAISDHPLGALWPALAPLPFPVHGRLERAAVRIDVWNSSPNPLILWRLFAIFDMMGDYTRIIDESLLYDICVDLLQLSG